MEFRELGQTGTRVSALGLGCMGMSHAYGVTDDQESLATLHLALDLGITFWDTADSYANGQNEALLAKVLAPNRDKVFIANKFGFRHDAAKGAFASPGSTVLDGSPTYLRTAVEQSLKRLKTEVIDLYYAHRIDPRVPVEDMVGAMADLVQQGKVRYLGLSEASAASIRKAHAVHPIAAVQSEYSLLSRDVEAEVLPTLRELGISFVPFSPLARGLVTNTLQGTPLPAADFRQTLPRFQGEHLANNQQLTAAFAALAQEKHCTPAQLALAWVLAQGEDIIPIPGTKKRRYLAENAGARAVTITPADSVAIEAVLARYPNTGNRYNEDALKFVNQ